MSVQIGAKPDSGFDDPIGMLTDCHRRIERFLGILCLVVRQAQGRALTDEERQAVEAALRYFRESGPRHNADEEDSLFPRLHCRQIPAVAQDVQRLEDEHRETGELHEEVMQLFAMWIAKGSLNRDQETRLLSITGKLQDVYRAHIRLEEDVIFPCAAQVLDRNELDAIGAEFKARRD